MPTLGIVSFLRIANIGNLSCVCVGTPLGDPRDAVPPSRRGQLEAPRGGAQCHIIRRQHAAP